MVDLTQLEALARAATPHWPAELDDLGDIILGNIEDSKVFAAICGYLLKAPPPAILALIERVRVAEANLVFLERDYADLKDGSYKQWKAMALLEIRYKSLLRSLTHAAAMSPPKPVLVEKDPTP